MLGCFDHEKGLHISEEVVSGTWQQHMFYDLSLNRVWTEPKWKPFCRWLFKTFLNTFLYWILVFLWFKFKWILFFKGGVAYTHHHGLGKLCVWMAKLFLYWIIDILNLDLFFCWFTSIFNKILLTGRKFKFCIFLPGPLNWRKFEEKISSSMLAVTGLVHQGHRIVRQTLLIATRGLIQGFGSRNQELTGNVSHLVEIYILQLWFHTWIYILCKCFGAK